MSRPIATSLTQLLWEHEGCKLSVYKCPAGHDTIGIGHNLDSHPLKGIERGREISQKQADAIFRLDIACLRVDLHRALPWYRLLDAVRQCVLEDLCFKKTLALIKAGNYEAAAVEMLRSQWADQVGERATRLSCMMRLGEWPTG